AIDRTIVDDGEQFFAPKLRQYTGDGLLFVGSSWRGTVDHPAVAFALIGYGVGTDGRGYDRYICRRQKAECCAQGLGAQVADGNVDLSLDQRAGRCFAALFRTTIV